MGGVVIVIIIVIVDSRYKKTTRSEGGKRSAPLAIWQYCIELFLSEVNKGLVLRTQTFDLNNAFYMVTYIS
jgi:hypothetical protein